MDKTQLKDHFVPLEDAPARVNKSWRTIYRWISEGRVKVLLVGGEKWLSVPDLLQTEKDMRR